MWVLSAKPWRGEAFSDGYYIGSWYMHQGGKYANVDKLAKAKIYKSENAAKNACSRLNVTCDNYKFDVVKIV